MWSFPPPSLLGAGRVGYEAVGGVARSVVRVVGALIPGGLGVYWAYSKGAHGLLRFRVDGT